MNDSKFHQIVNGHLMVIEKELDDILVNFEGIS